MCVSLLGRHFAQMMKCGAQSNDLMGKESNIKKWDFNKQLSAIRETSSSINMSQQQNTVNFFIEDVNGELMAGIGRLSGFFWERENFPRWMLQKIWLFLIDFYSRNPGEVYGGLGSL